MPEEFRRRLEQARSRVAAARADQDPHRLAQALRELANVERRPPFLYEAALGTLTEAATLCRDLGQPLDEAWCIRHIGIIREYQHRLDDAEKAYDEALAIYRGHAAANSLDYANTVRYPAVVKNRLGKREEAARLWQEAYDRYAQVGPGGQPEGLAEGAAWLAIFAIEADRRDLAQQWLQRATEAAVASADPETHIFVASVAARLQSRNGDPSSPE
jgi:tetratricopeptide (TPR) repeat protein